MPDSKEQFIEQLFSSIAPRYDLLNSVLSLNQHGYWRRFAVRECRLAKGDRVLDVAAGTLDFSFELARAVGPIGRVVAVDFCAPMLEIGKAKMARRGVTNVDPVLGNAERLELESDTFKAATIGFALRNVASVERTLAEMTRVVEPGGRVVSLELAVPQGRIFQWLYRYYALRMLPFIGGIVSRQRQAYEYLPASVVRFHSREELAQLMVKVGLTDIQVFDLTGGVVTVHVGIKK